MRRIRFSGKKQDLNWNVMNEDLNTCAHTLDRALSSLHFTSLETLWAEACNYLTTSLIAAVYYMPQKYPEKANTY